MNGYVDNERRELDIDMAIAADISGDEGKVVRLKVEYYLASVAAGDKATDAITKLLSKK